jgi:hypothetical protein
VLGALFGCALFGCERPLVVGESGGTSGASKGSDSSQTLAEHCPDVARLRVADDTCWPTAHVGRWHGFVTGDAEYYVALAGPFVYPSGDVRLNVDLAGTGTLTFTPAGPGSGALDAGLDAAAPDAAVADAAAADAAAALPAGVSEGFAYALLDLSMSGSPSTERRLDRSMQFSVSLAEPQASASSAATDSASVCDACGSAPAAFSGALTLSVALTLSADRTALRGTLSTPGPGGPLPAGLELIRE